MNLFENSYKDGYLKYHNNYIVPNSLDPRTFYYPPEGGDPVLHPEIKLQVLTDIARFNTLEGDFGTTRVKEYYLIGPILKPGASDRCPIFIKVQLEENNLTDVLKEKILNCMKDIDGRLATGTQHPVMYIPTVRPLNPDDYDSAYHPYTDKWVKKVRSLGEGVSSLEGLAKDPAKKKKKHALVRGQLRKHLHQTKH
jgi:hypothetical protein